MALPGSTQALSSAQARLFDQALGLLGAGDSGGALAIARRIATEAAHAPDAQQLLAMCHAEAGNAGAAEQAFRRALELAPKHPLILMNYAALLRRVGRHGDAVAALEQAVVAAPEFAKAWSELGIAALAAGDSRRALAAFGRAVERQPDSAFDWHGFGNARRAQDDLEGAEAAFRKAVALAPNYGSAWLNLGVVLRMQGRADEAIECFDRAEAIGYADPQLIDARAGALLDRGSPDKALEQARHLVRQHPEFAPGYATLGHLLWEYGSSLAPGEEPVGAFRAALRDYPNNASLRLAFAQFLLKARQAEEALDHLRKLRAQSDQPALAALEADALENLGRTEQAGLLYAQVHRALAGSDPAFLNAYARHLLRAGKWDIAAEKAAEAVQADPVNQEAWAYLGTAWRLLDDPREFWLCDYERLVALIEVEPPEGFANTADFLAALSTTLETLHQAGREPVQQSLRGGSQTPGRLFGRQDPVIAAARAALKRAVERWLGTLPSDAQHPFLMRRADSIRFSGSWSVKLWSSGNHVNHIHPEGWMSSAFYVSLPPSVTSQAANDNAGCIQFGQPPLELNLNLSPRRVIRPAPCSLALFPSYLWHGTVPFHDDRPRLTMAFDMLPQDRDRSSPG